MKNDVVCTQHCVHLQKFIATGISRKPQYYESGFLNFSWTILTPKIELKAVPQSRNYYQ